jgi:hypothetical protein
VTDIRATRCEELKQAILEFTPLVIGGQADAGRLRQALPAIARIRSVADAGAEGIDDAAYTRWVADAPRNLDALESAAATGDGPAAWAAFTDTSGIPALATGCAGYPGW